MPRYDAVLFDVDGTLIHSRPGIENSFAYAFAQMGLDPAQIDVSRYLGPPLRWSFAQHFSHEADVERFRLESAQKETAAYVEQVRALHAKAVAYLDQLSQLTPPPPTETKEEKVEEAVSDIDDSVQRLVAQAMAEAAAENEKNRQAGENESGADQETGEDAPLQAEEENLEKTTRIDFGELQFGRDYEIK